MTKKTKLSHLKFGDIFRFKNGKVVYVFESHKKKEFNYRKLDYEVIFSTEKDAEIFIYKNVPKIKKLNSK